MTMSLGCCSVGNATACHAPQCLLTTVLPLNDYWCIWRLSRTWTHDQLHAKCSRITLIRHPGVTEITFSLILSTSLKMFRMEGTGTRWSRLVANHSWISTTSYFWYGSDVIHRSTIILWRYDLETDTAFNSIRLLRSWALSIIAWALLRSHRGWEQVPFLNVVWLHIWMGLDDWINLRKWPKLVTTQTDSAYLIVPDIWSTMGSIVSPFKLYLVMLNVARAIVQEMKRDESANTRPIARNGQSWSIQRSQLRNNIEHHLDKFCGEKIDSWFGIKNIWLNLPSSKSVGCFTGIRFRLGSQKASRIERHWVRINIWIV